MQASNAIQVGRFQGFLNFIVYLSQEGLGQQSPSETPALSTEVTNAHLSQVGRTVGVVFINFSFISESNPEPGWGTPGRGRGGPESSQLGSGW